MKRFTLDHCLENIAYLSIMENKKYSLDYNKSKSKKNFTKLICHLDEKLFYGLLTKKYTNWNQPTVGTLVLYERKPNKFDPNLLFSLNFLTT